MPQSGHDCRSILSARSFLRNLNDVKVPVTGGFSTILRKKIAHFNGGLFADCFALTLNQDQLERVLEAAKSNWADVGAAIFGTLLERVLEGVCELARLRRSFFSFLFSEIAIKCVCDSLGI